MTKHALMGGLLSLAVLLSGCSLLSGQDHGTKSARASSSDVDLSCSAANVEGLIGHAITRELAERARIDARANRVRVLGPEDPIGMDYDSTRLNIDVDRTGKVMSISCG